MKLYRMSEAASLLGITPHYMWRLRKRFKFPYVKRAPDFRERYVTQETIDMLAEYLDLKH